MSLVRKADGTTGLVQWPMELGEGLEVTIVATGVAQQVSGTSVPCQQVLVQPKVGAGGASSNAETVLVGTATSQLVQVRPDDFGVWLPTSDRNKLYVKGTIGDVVRITPAV